MRPRCVFKVLSGAYLVLAMSNVNSYTASLGGFFIDVEIKETSKLPESTFCGSLPKIFAFQLTIGDILRLYGKVISRENIRKKCGCLPFHTASYMGDEELDGENMNASARKILKAQIIKRQCGLIEYSVEPGPFKISYGGLDNVRIKIALDDESMNLTFDELLALYSSLGDFLYHKDSRDWDSVKVWRLNGPDQRISVFYKSAEGVDTDSDSCLEDVAAPSRQTSPKLKSAGPARLASSKPTTPAAPARLVSSKSTLATSAGTKKLTLSKSTSAASSAIDLEAETSVTQLVDSDDGSELEMAKKKDELGLLPFKAQADFLEDFQCENPSVSTSLESILYNNELWGEALDWWVKHVQFKLTQLGISNKYLFTRSDFYPGIKDASLVKLKQNSSLEFYNPFDGNVELLFSVLNLSRRHWVLFVTDVKAYTMTIYDSVKSKASHKDIYKNMKKWLDVRYSRENPGKVVLFSEKSPVQVVPKQRHSLDCGVFTCMYMSYLCFNKPFDFSQNDMDVLRRWMFSQVQNFVLDSTL